MAGNKLTAFQRRRIERGETDILDVLEEFAHRLLASGGYPPILPVAGKELRNILVELEEAIYVERQRSVESDTAETSAS